MRTARLPGGFPRRAAGAAAGLALALTIWLPPAQAKIVCWTNSEGVRECGNSVPPEYAQQSREVKSKQGITIERMERAKTKEELERERVERERLAAEEAQRKLRQEEQARRDRVLLSTFTTEEDLRLTRDGKIAAIDSRIKHGHQVLTKLEQTLVELQGEAARLERSGKTVTPDLEKSISDIRAQLDETSVQIARHNREREEVQATFDEDLVRYRELKGIASQ